MNCRKNCSFDFSHRYHVVMSILFFSCNISILTTRLQCEVIGKVILNLMHVETYILIGCGPLCYV